jgi:hypothetical protein
LGYDEMECLVVAGEDKGVELHHVIPIDADLKTTGPEMVDKHAAVIIPETGTDEIQAEVHSGGGLLDGIPET